MKKRFFDFEVYPHWWCCAFGDMPDDMVFDETIKETFKVVTSDSLHCRDELLALMKEPNVVLMGYNIKFYDLVIANGIYQGFSPEQLKILNDVIINPGCQWDSKEHMRMFSLSKRRLSGIVYEDLMDDSEGSLKQKEAILGLNILETEVPFDQEVLSDEDKKNIIYYNKQDVYASMYWFKEIVHPYCMTKLAIGKRFNIPEDVCYKSTNANLVALALGAKRSNFEDEERIDIELPPQIKQYCYENVPNHILEHILNKNTALHTTAFGNDVDYGNGGIHSVYKKCLYVESDDEWILMNIDAESYYPSEMRKFKTLSRTVNNPQVLEDIFQERMSLKHKDTLTEEEEAIQKADKLVMNTTFGASGNKYLNLYDPYQCTRTCRIGQIFLTALACKLRSKVQGFEVIQGNTDGLLCYFRRKDLEQVRAICKEWMTISGINLEEDLVSKIWQRDVNNYLLVKENGKIKVKGGWLNNTIYRKGTVKLAPLNAFICADAAIKFLTEGVDPIKTIVNCKDLSRFALICTKGPTYRYAVQKMSNGNEVKLFNCNRVYASKDTSLGMIYKCKMFKGNLQYTKMAGVPEHSRLINEALDTYDFDKDIKPDLDYTYYILNTFERLNIEWLQLKGSSLTYTKRFNYNI